MTKEQHLNEIIKLSALKSASALSRIINKPVSIQVASDLSCKPFDLSQELLTDEYKQVGYYGAIKGDLEGFYISLHSAFENQNSSTNTINLANQSVVMLNEFISWFSFSFGLNESIQQIDECNLSEVSIQDFLTTLKENQFEECMQIQFNFSYDGIFGSIRLYVDKVFVLRLLENAPEQSRDKNKDPELPEWNINPIIEINDDGEIIYLNLTARAQFPELFKEGSKHLLLQGIDNWISNRKSYPFDTTICSREVSFMEHHYEQQILMLGNRKQILIYINDITERKQLREQAMMNDRLATVGTLAAGVAHEINNPIAWVLENLRYLKESTTLLKRYLNVTNRILMEPDHEARLQYLENMSTMLDYEELEKIYKFEEIVDETLQGAVRIRDIVRDLKGFSRIDKTEVTTVDINSVINTTISMAVPEFKYRARLEKRLATNLPPLLVNSGKLHQVILNLIVNAAQAIPEGNIQQNTISVTTELEKDKIKIEISDTGAGIPKDVLPRIFDPFFTTKEDGSGTGLGLAIVHEVIGKFGGEIKVESVVNVGTTFTIYLPAHFELSYDHARSETPAKAKVAAKKILVIDDEISLIKTLERMLSPHHQVTTVLGGEAAKNLLSRRCNDFDVIICDLNMPNVNGADLYQFVSEHSPGRENNFIFITAGVYTPSMIAFLNHIHNVIIEKPFDPKELLDAIDKIIIGEAHVY